MKADKDQAARLWRAYSAARVRRAKAEIAAIEARERAEDCDRVHDEAIAACDLAAGAWRAAIDQQTTDPDGAVPAGNPKED